MTIDVSDLDRGLGFWGGLLGLEPAARDGTYVWLGEMCPGTRLVLQKVADPKPGKNRVHLDLAAADPGAVIDRIVAAGGSRLEDFEEETHSLTVMADPDGNEFCVIGRPSAVLAASMRLA